MAWIVENWDLIAAFLSSLIGLLLATKWGNAHKEALMFLAMRIECRDADPGGVKRDLKQDVKSLPGSVQDALRVVADTVDHKRTPEPRWKRFGKLVGRLALGLVFRRLG